MSGARLPLSLLGALTASSVVCWGLIPIQAAAPQQPGVRLITAANHVILQRYDRSDPVHLDLGAYIAPTSGPFEIRVERTIHGDRIKAAQVTHGDQPRLLTLPKSLKVTFAGFQNFLHLRVRDKLGSFMRTFHLPWCPNDVLLQRVNEDSPDLPRYPQLCGSHPFTVGMVWGIDQGWSVGALTGGVPQLRAPDGRYTARLSIDRSYRDAFAISRAEATAEVTFDVETVPCAPSCSSARRHPVDGSRQASSTVKVVPRAAPQDKSTLPDLRPLPAFAISVDNDRRRRDYLRFAATVWVAGNGPLVVEGFRRDGATVMDAYQYFYSDGKAVGRARVGTLKFHAPVGHQHWHFQQFVIYRLLNKAKDRAVQSAKQSFCLAPTDPIDLVLKGAEWRPDTVGLHSACGASSSLWVRQSLPIGWGDTYLQAIPGQAFDITNLPNGTCFVQVHANPKHLLYETKMSNNVRLRKILLQGRRGHRRVVVQRLYRLDNG